MPKKEPEIQEWVDLVDRIRQAVEYAGGPTKAAAASGLSRRTINAYRIGETTPSSERLLALALGTATNPAWLLTGKGPMKIGDVPIAQDWGKKAAENVVPYQAEHASINAEILSQALALVLQELQNRKATLPPSKIAAAVVEIYELVTSQGKKEVALDNVTPFVRLLLAR